MNDHIHPQQTPADDEPDAGIEAGLRAAFGPFSTAASWSRHGVLEALRQSTGVTPRVLLAR